MPHIKKITIINNEDKTISPTFILNNSLLGVKGELERLIPPLSSVEYSLVVENISVFREDLNISEKSYDNLLTLKSNECKEVILLSTIERKKAPPFSFDALIAFLDENIATIKLTKNVSFILKFYQVIVGFFLLSSIFLRSQLKNLSLLRKISTIIFSTFIFTTIFKVITDLIKAK